MSVPGLPVVTRQPGAGGPRPAPPLSVSLSDLDARRAPGADQPFCDRGHPFGAGGGVLVGLGQGVWTCQPGAPTRVTRSGSEAVISLLRPAALGAMTVIGTVVWMHAPVVSAAVVPALLPGKRGALNTMSEPPVTVTRARLRPLTLALNTHRSSMVRSVPPVICTPASWVASAPLRLLASTRVPASRRPVPLPLTPTP